MNFRTTIEITPSPWRITHQHSGMAFGSCFAESITQTLARLKYNITCNPFGALYNPLSIVKCIKRIAEARPYSAEELTEWQGRWFSMDAHTLMDAPSAEEALVRLNETLATAHQALAKADYIIITLGTDYVYEQRGEVVTNCHKLPSSQFTRRKLAIEEMWQALNEVIDKELVNKQIIITVSPIRHIKDGLAESSLSKASLRVVASQLTNKQCVSYFPSYEIMMDDLRDYRFYAPDMVHPSEVAITYINEHFGQAWLAPAEQELNRRIERFVKGCEHRPFDTSSEAFHTFIKTQKSTLETLKKECPTADFTKEEIFLDDMAR